MDSQHMPQLWDFTDDAGCQSSEAQNSSPALPGEESEYGPDPSLLVSDPEDEGMRVSPVPSGPFFQGQMDTSRPPDGPCRADDSVQSNGSGDSKHQGQRIVPPYVRLAPLLRRVQTLESKVGSLQVTLPESFGVVRGELNEVWAELSDLRRPTPPLDPRSSSPPTYFQERQQNSTSAAGVSTLHPIVCFFPISYEAGN